MRPILGAVAATYLMGLALHPAKANFFDDVAGIVTDPLKLGKLSDGVQRSLIQIDQLG
jgi:hypothetical protein